VKIRLLAMLLVAGCGISGPATTNSSTTTVEATTTTDAATSTTSTGSEAVPVVASRYGLMGWWAGEWVMPDGVDDIPLSGDEEYQVVMLDQPIATAVGSLPTLCEPSLTPVLEFDPPLPGDFGEPGALAVIADWELRPAPVRVEDEMAEVHTAAVAEVLSSLGIEADPVIFQQIAADLDADGAEEVVIVAKQLAEDLFGQPGDYSVVILRKMIEGEWQTAILETSLAEPDSAYILSHSIAAIADLNDDGKMEIAVDAAYYEGAGTTAYEYIDDDLGPEPVLGGGCGA
jgi:hypothetical protein